MKAIELSKAANTSVHTVRYYNRIGLLKVRRNRRNGYHEFTEMHLELLGFIRRCRVVGMSLAEVRAFVGAASRGRVCCPNVAVIVRRVLPAIEAQISELVMIRNRMKAFERRSAHGMPTGADVSRLVESLGT